SYQVEDLEEDLHEDSSDQEEDLDEDSCDQSEDLYKDSSDPEVFYDEDSSDLEKYLRFFDEGDQEEDLGKDNSDQDDSNDGDMANNQALAFHLDSPMGKKLRKHENNLMNWKWDQVIVIEDSDDEVDLLYSEGISLWEEDNNNIYIVSNGVIVGEKDVDEYQMQ
nr:alpha/beta hydrolase fold protein [Tanacetum cinerariifolium]